MIYNKRGEKTVKLYDLRENILFETADVTVAVKEVGDLTGFLEEAEELVVTKTYNYGAGVRTYGNSYPGYPSYGGYSAQKKEEPKKENSSWEKPVPLCREIKAARSAKGNVRKEINLLVNR